MRFCAIFTLILTLQQSGPAPDAALILARLQENFGLYQSVLRQYSFTETATSFDRDGQPKKEWVDVMLVLPDVGYQQLYRRLISRGGKLISEEENRRTDRKNIESMARDIGKDKVQVLIDNHFQWNPPLAVLPLLFPSDELVNEFFKTYEFTMQGRETIEGYDVIRFAFRHKSDPSPKQERLLPKLVGEFWVTEDGNLVRVKAEIVGSTPAELRCSKSHVHNLLNGRVKGVSKLPCLPLGRKKVVPRDAFERWKLANLTGTIPADSGSNTVDACSGEHVHA